MPVFNMLSRIAGGTQPQVGGHFQDLDAPYSDHLCVEQGDVFDHPTAAPTLLPTPLPTSLPIALHTALPTVLPTPLPTALPTALPTPLPTPPPTVQPTVLPTVLPTPLPSSLPTTKPTALPSQLSVAAPTSTPSAGPSSSPAVSPTFGPTLVPTSAPSSPPSRMPTHTPSARPTPAPTASFLEVVRPQAFDAAVGGTLQMVEWVSRGSAADCANVIVELYSGTSLSMVIASSTPNAPRALDWYPPDDLAFGSEYRILVACSGGSYEAFSEYFSVDATPRPSPVPSPGPSPLPSPAPTAGPPRARITGPSPEITESSTLVLVEPSQRIVFSGSVESGEPDVAVQWSSPDIVVNDTTLFSTASNTLYLVAKAGQLLAGRQYIFGFTATDSLGRSDTANITVRGNRPPVNGTLWTVPRRGYALDTKFGLVTRGWKDPDDPEGTSPLGYRFAFISGDGASVTISSGGSTTLNGSMLPLGSNLTLQVVATDTYGASGEAYDDVIVTLGTDNVAGAVKNATSSIDALVTSGDTGAATALIASCSDMLNVASSGHQAIDRSIDRSADRSRSSSGEDDTAASSVREVLLALLVAANSTPGTEPNADTVALQAITLGLTVGVPAQVNEATQRTGVNYASNVVASVSTISEATRSPIVGALSSIIHAGFLQLETRRRRLTSGSAASEISQVLQNIHLLTLQDLVPGEEPVMTRSTALSLSSSKASCSLGSCMNAQVRAPALLDDDAGGDGAASFELGETTLQEIVTGGSVKCAVGGSAELGMMATTWKSNPYDEEDGAVETNETRFAEVGNVTSLSLTACGDHIAVENLTSPIAISLPVSSRFNLPSLTSTREVLRGVCDAEGQHTVYCNTTGWRPVSVACPGAGAKWNVTCEAASTFPACRFFDESNGRWGTAGCEVVSSRSADAMLDMVDCQCN